MLILILPMHERACALVHAACIVSCQTVNTVKAVTKGGREAASPQRRSGAFRVSGKLVFTLGVGF